MIVIFIGLIAGFALMLTIGASIGRDAMLRELMDTSTHAYYSSKTVELYYKEYVVHYTVDKIEVNKNE